LRVGPEQVEKGSKDLIARYAGIEQEQREEDRRKRQAALHPLEKPMISAGRVYFGAADYAKTLLCSPERAKPLAIGILVVHREDEQHAAN
jgi:hypothetical protein